MSIVLTAFARTRLFPRDGRRTAIQDCTAEQFERHLNERSPLKVLDGYAHGYPEPVVDHAEERREALRRYEETRRS